MARQKQFDERKINGIVIWCSNMVKSHLKFEERPKSTWRKTSTFEVKTKDGVPLGYVVWRSGWRQYVFSPLDLTNFSHDCLAEISRFIISRMEERKVRLS